MINVRSVNLFMDTDCTCKNLLECLYNLSSSDLDILVALLRSKEPLTLEIISKAVKKGQRNDISIIAKVG